MQAVLKSTDIVKTYRNKMVSFVPLVYLTLTKTRPLSPPPPPTAIRECMSVISSSFTNLRVPLIDAMLARLRNNEVIPRDDLM